MRLSGYGFCTYHDIVVDEFTLCRKNERCLECDYLIPTEKYTTVEEASELLKKSQATIRSWIKKGKLKAISVEFSDRYRTRSYRYSTYFIERESLQKFRNPKAGKVRGAGEVAELRRKAKR